MTRALEILAIAAVAVLAAACRVQPACTEALSIKGSVGNMPAIIQKPEMRPGQKVPIVIVCHGLTGNKNEDHLTAVTDRLQAQGVASIRFDFNGHGEADGEFVGMTLANEREDAHKVFEYVETLDWVDHSRVAIAGHSQGGAVAGMVAGDLGTGRIRCLGLWAPAACIHTMAMEGRMFEYAVDFDNIPESMDFWGLKLGGEYLKAARELDIHALTARYEGPAVIVQGSDDDPTIYAQSRRYLDYMKNCDYIELPGLHHCYDPDIPAAAEPAAAWLVEHLK